MLPASMLNPNDPSQDVLNPDQPSVAASRLTIPTGLLEKLGLLGIAPGDTYTLTFKAGSLGDQGLDVEALAAAPDTSTETGLPTDALATDGLDEAGMGADLMGEAEQPLELDEPAPLPPPGNGKPVPTRKSPKEMFGRKPKPYGPDGKRIKDEEEAA